MTNKQQAKIAEIKRAHPAMTDYQTDEPTSGAVEFSFTEMFCHDGPNEYIVREHSMTIDPDGLTIEGSFTNRVVKEKKA